MNLSRSQTEPVNGMVCRRSEASTAGSFCQNCVVRTRAFCAVLDDDALARLDQSHTIVNLDSEDGLFMEGDDATSFFTVLSGALRLSKLLPDGRRQITGFVLPGEFVGLSDGDTYVDNAEALTEASLCRFTVSDLKRIGQDNPEMDSQMLAMTNNTLTQARDHMLLLGRMKAPEKIASFLTSLLDRASAADQPTDPLALPMSRADIADYLGLTIETVSRTFTRLKADKIIALPEHNRVSVNNMEALVQLAEG
ncbi:MAG: helix-turn-helix domain-containing protein [Rhodospirillaceae bacterium]|nr:helix-turn-helix domain-containing protein [Rhodospirillaceae bacterium]MBT7760121.1 helix-turn-helix domain-containing protein [Rhodospirillaceae bacterium]